LFLVWAYEGDPRDLRELNLNNIFIAMSPASTCHFLIWNKMLIGFRDVALEPGSGATFLIMLSLTVHLPQNLEFKEKPSEMCAGRAKIMGKFSTEQKIGY
jgi:hypothetical protein